MAINYNFFKPMRVTIYLLLISMLLVSCSNDDKRHRYTTAIRNVSNQPFRILILGIEENPDIIVYDTLLNTIVSPNTHAFIRMYKAPNFVGIKDFGVNKNNNLYYIKIVFVENGKGYICEKDNTDTNVLFCFQNKRSPIEANQEKDFNFKMGIYYYDITQEDYENAHELLED